MISLTSQPDNPFFWWQNLVQFCNLEAIGQLEHHRAIFICQSTVGPSKWLFALKKQFPNNVFFYSDLRPKQHYIPSIKLHGFARYFEDFPEEQNQDVFTFDSDVIFREAIDFSLFTEPNTIYGSDTNSYLNHSYIMQKGEPMLQAMCASAGIDPAVVEENDKNSVGAQLYYKQVPGLLQYFTRGAISCVELYDSMVGHSTYNNPDVPIQAWTAEMWMVLWEAWKQGTKTKVSDELDFSWATMLDGEWRNNKMLHMAGLTEDNCKGKFMKSRFVNKFPFWENHDLNDTTITKRYVDWFEEIKKQPKYEKLSHLEQFWP